MKKTIKMSVLTIGLMLSPQANASWTDIDISGILNNLSSLTSGADDIFANFDLASLTDDILGDSELLKCLSSSFDPSSLLSGYGGICDSLELGDSLGFDSLDIGELAGCALGNSNPLSGITKQTDKLKALCSGATSGSGGSGSGSGGGGTTPPAGGGGGGGTATAPVFTTAYTSSLIHIQGGKEEAGALSSEGTTLKAQPYAGGVTGDDVFFRDGGIIAKEAIANPSSSTGTAYKKGDLASQLLKEAAYKQTGVSDESAIGLPATMGKAMEDSMNMAQLMARGEVDYYSYSKVTVGALKPIYRAITADTLSDYYKKEKQEWRRYIDADRKVQAMAKLQSDTKASRLAEQIFLLRSKKGAIYDVSEKRVQLLPVEARTRYRLKAMRQIAQGTIIRTKMAIEDARDKQLAQIAIDKTYASSSIFRADIAKKEIEAMLNAIDTVIR